MDIIDFFQGELVGREAELAQLREFVEPLFASDGEQRFAGILAVEGEAGLGKSRLVSEFLERLAVGEGGDPGIKAHWFLCQTDQTVCQPFNPFRYWLRNYFSSHSDWRILEMKQNSDFLDDAVGWFDYGSKTCPGFQLRGLSAVLKALFESKDGEKYVRELLDRGMGTEVVVTLAKQ